MADEPASFVARWSRRKVQARSDLAVPPEVMPTAATMAPATMALASAPTNTPPAVLPAATHAEPADRPPGPTMADVALLSKDSDYARFVGAEVDVGVTRAAMKKLFSDPHFNVMDGLDTYIDDYGRPDPIPMSMLRQMNQSKFLGLFDDEPKTDDEPTSDDDPPRLAEPPHDLSAAPPDLAAPLEDTRHDDPDLRLQQDDDAGRSGPVEGARA